MLRECGDDDAGARLGAALPILFLTETRQPGSDNRVPSGSLSMPKCGPRLRSMPIIIISEIFALASIITVRFGTEA